MARDKRGSHLAFSLERLDALVTEAGGRLQRIGLSATQRPLDLVARLLTGVHEGRQPPVIVDCGHARDLEVAIELPTTELEAVMSGGQMSDILDRIAEHTRHHRTTLVFVNTRKMAERVAHQLAERLARNEPAPTGTARRTATWMRRSSSPRTTAASPPRAGASSRPACGPATCGPWWPPPRSSSASTSGRSSWCARSAHHAPSGRSCSASAGPTTTATGRRPGRLYPTTRDELVECTALLAAVREGRLDLLEPPVAPLDVLTQQLVAEVAAAGERDVEDLWKMARAAAPYAELGRPGLRRGGRPGQLGHRDRPGPARRRTCTTTRSTAACAPGAGRAWPP